MAKRHTEHAWLYSLSMLNSKWSAKLSNGEVIYEDWREGELSPWQRLMAYCRKNKLYVVQMALSVDNKTKYVTKANADGYWCSYAGMAVQGGGSKQIAGIGHVEGDIVHVAWTGGSGHNPEIWGEVRSAKGQNQIIWSRMV